MKFSWTFYLSMITKEKTEVGATSETVLSYNKIEE